MTDPRSDSSDEPQNEPQNEPQHVVFGEPLYEQLGVQVREPLGAAAAAELDAACRLLVRFRAGLDVGSFTDDELLLVASAAAEVGRACSAVEVAVAGEVGERSRPVLGGERLSARKGCRNANELLQRVGRVSSATAARLLRVGEAIRPGMSLTGESLPARFPILAGALAAAEGAACECPATGATAAGGCGAGGVGVEAAHAIVAGLSVSSLRADPAVVAAAERELVRAAQGVSVECPVPATPDELRVQAAVWRTVIDPDGVEPDEERAMRHRHVTLGRATASGVPLTGMLLPETAARLQRIFDAYMSPASGPVAFPVTTPATGPDGGQVAGSASNGDGGLGADGDSQAESVSGADNSSSGEPVAVVADGRSRGMRQHDVFAAALDAAGRSAETPSIGGASATVLVSVSQSDLTSGVGAGWVDGSDVPVSMRTVRQLVCAGGVQKVTLTDDGRIVRLGTEQRCFDGRQRRAITLRDGGCVIPGCRVPASWCEIHHVTEHAVGGATHTDNGVLLCWYHHRTIETSGWEIRVHGGVPQITAPPWIDRRHRNWAASTKSRTRLNHEFNERLEP